MNWERIVLFGGAGGVLVTWLAGASTPTPAGPTLVPAPPAPAVTLSFPEVDRLRERLQAPIPPAAPSRNLFAFQPRRPVHRVVGRPLAPAASPLPVTAVVPARRTPPYTLIGLAEDQAEGGPVRTAILSSPGGISFAKVGDLVGEYRVSAISVDALQLTAPDDTTPFVLTLK